MKKIAFISENSYVHIDFTLLPILNKEFKIGWFPFFSYTTTNARIDDFLSNCKEVEVSEFKYLKLSSRLRTFTTKNELKIFLLYIKSWNPDVVYINADGIPWLPILVKRVFKNIPVIAAIHDVNAHSGSDLITRIYKPLLPHIYHYLNTYSNYSYDLLTKKIKNKVITCCHHPLTDFGKIERKKHDKFTILFFGNILAYKGLPLLLEVGEEVYKKNKNICIKIVGTGADEYLLEPYKNHPAFNIINRRVEDSEIPEIFSDIDCLALPYNDATQSGPMMIALNYAIPVLASKIDAFKWYGEKFSDIYLLEKDTKAWINEIMKRIEIFPKSFSNNEIFQKEIESERKEIALSWKNLFNYLEKKIVL